MAASWLGLVVPFLARFAALVYRQTSYPKANTDYTAAVMLGCVRGDFQRTL